MKITVKMLKDKRASQDQIDIFVKEWPKVMVVSEESLTRAIESKVDIYWLAMNLLSDDEREEFDRVLTPADEEFYRVTAPFQAKYKKSIAADEAEYKKAIALAVPEPILNIVEFNKATASVWKKLNEAIAPAIAELNKNISPAWDELEKAQIVAFLSAIGG